ncbi:hypothetical protein KC19_9G153500 [Ceratodon purpureus]|uniref:Secreted protein n=1 Tax=Ceratodon purpureus TaxID=3225 RepID=A0A8T0GXQ4_CERPU|nr:hypothetical protein KC19_9G153500 [Ceratodon purpureus]
MLSRLMMFFLFELDLLLLLRVSMMLTSKLPCVLIAATREFCTVSQLRSLDQHPISTPSFSLLMSEIVVTCYSQIIWLHFQR